MARVGLRASPEPTAYQFWDCEPCAPVATPSLFRTEIYGKDAGAQGEGSGYGIVYHQSFDASATNRSKPYCPPSRQETGSNPVVDANKFNLI